MNNYIIINNKKDIFGIYNDLNLALNIVLDNYILQFDSILEILEQNKFFKLSHISNSYKIKAMINNSNITCKEIYFCFKKFIFYDNSSFNNYFSEDDYTYISKIRNIKNLYKNIIETNNNQESDLNIFIPNNIFNQFENNNLLQDDINLNEDKNQVNEDNNQVNEDNNQVNEGINKDNTKVNDLSEDELLLKIKTLEEKEKMINSSISDLKVEINESEIELNNINKNSYTQSNNLSYIKDELSNSQNKFKINLKIYNEIKDKVKNKEMEIPELFVDEFKLFEYFEKENINDEEKLKLYYTKIFKKNYVY